MKPQVYVDIMKNIDTELNAMMNEWAIDLNGKGLNPEYNMFLVFSTISNCLHAKIIGAHVVVEKHPNILTGIKATIQHLKECNRDTEEFYRKSFNFNWD